MCPNAILWVGQRRISGIEGLGKGRRKGNWRGEDTCLRGRRIEGPIPASGSVRWTIRWWGRRKVETDFGDDFRQTDDACFCETVVRLAAGLGTPLVSFGCSSVEGRVRRLIWKGRKGTLRIPVNPTRAADIDDIPGLAVLDAEIGRCCPDELKGRGVVQGEDRVPLLVCHL